MLISKDLIKNKWAQQKERLLHLFWQASALGGNLTMWLSFLHPAVWPRWEYIWALNWDRDYWFILKTARMFLFLTSKNRMMNTFVIVTLSPHVRDSSKEVYAFPFQKDLPSPLSLARNSIYLGTHLTEELNDLFWKLPGYSLFPSGRVDSNENILLVVNIDPIWCNEDK